TTMSESNKRDEWDEHNRDEATKRAVQQKSAGPTHRPVPVAPYASHGGLPATPEAARDVGALIQDYERAAETERLAWLALRHSVADDRSSEAWNHWRDAVERTQQAARSLVNCGT